MSLISPIKLNISQKLKNKEYFHKFFVLRTKTEIAEQIRGLRNKRKHKQSELANLANMKQSAISRIEQSEYAGWNFNTLLRVAEALDARVQVIFTPAEDVIEEYEEKERVLWASPVKKTGLSSIYASLGETENNLGQIFTSHIFGQRKQIEDEQAPATLYRRVTGGTYRDNPRAGDKAISRIQPSR